MCVGKSVPGTLGGWHDWILAAYFGDWYISVLWTRNVLILDLRQQNAWENKLCLIVVFLGAEESSCCGGGAASPTAPGSIWTFQLCVLWKQQLTWFMSVRVKPACSLSDKRDCHPLYAHFRVKLLEEWASNEYNGEGGIDSPLFGFDYLEMLWLPKLFLNLIWRGSVSPSLLSEFIFKSNCCRAHAFPAVGWSILGMHGGGKVSEKQFQGGLCTYIPGH